MAAKDTGQVLDWPTNSMWPGHSSRNSIDLAKELPNLPPAKTPLESARNGYEYYKRLQAHDGHWPGEYSGPMFLTPGLVIGSYVAGMPFTDEERREMIRYSINYANEDGGWGVYVYVSYHLLTRPGSHSMVPVTLEDLLLLLGLR